MSPSLTGPLPPSLYDVLMGLKDDTFRDLRCCLPAIIINVNTINGTVDVNITVMQQNADGISRAYPQLTGCPLMTLQGGGVGVSFPVKVGDKCVVFFSDRCLDSWYKNGAVPEPLPSLRMHNLSDGFVLVGVNTLTNLLSTPLVPGEGGLCETKSGSIRAKVAIDPVDHKVTVNNGLPAGSLNDILQSLITHIQAIKVGGVPVDAPEQAALATDALNLGNLLY